MAPKPISVLRKTKKSLLLFQLFVLVVEKREVGNNDRNGERNGEHTGDSTQRTNQFADQRLGHFITVPNGCHGYNAVPERIRDGTERPLPRPRSPSPRVLCVEYGAGEEDDAEEHEEDEHAEFTENEKYEILFPCILTDSCSIPSNSCRNTNFFRNFKGVPLVRATRKERAGLPIGQGLIAVEFFK